MDSFYNGSKIIAVAQGGKLLSALAVGGKLAFEDTLPQIFEPYNVPTTIRAGVDADFTFICNKNTEYLITFRAGNGDADGAGISRSLKSRQDVDGYRLITISFNIGTVGNARVNVYPSATSSASGRNVNSKLTIPLTVVSSSQLNSSFGGGEINEFDEPQEDM